MQTTKLTRAAWRYIPSTYLVCENDKAAPPQYQEMFAAISNAQVEKCSSGHSPHLSQPKMLVQKIHEAAQKVVAGLAPLTGGSGAPNPATGNDTGNEQGSQ